MTAAFDREFALAECSHLRSLVLKHLEVVTATERFAVAGAAAFAAFSVSGLTPELEGARLYLSMIPFVVVSLAGLRCLTIYVVMRAVLRYIESVEHRLLEDPMLGVQRRSLETNAPVRRGIEIVSGLYWVFACAAALAFWLMVNDLA